MVQASIPARPDLTGRPPVLNERIVRAEAKAESFFHAVAGLGELSRLYHANGFFDEAIQCYDGLRRMQPHEARWPHLQASLFSGLGRLDEALPLEQRAVALAPLYVPARLRLGDILLKSNRTDEAASIYAVVLVREPGNPYALLGLAKCDATQRRWSQARDHLQEAVRLHPDFVGALSMLVTVAEHVGEQAQAAALRERIGNREFKDMPDAWLDALLDDCYDAYQLSVAAATAKLAGNTTLAKQLLERATRLAPNTGSYHRQLGQLFSQISDKASARQQLERAVELSPQDSDAWLSLYQLLNNNDHGADTVAAGRVLTAGLSHCPQSYGLHLELARRLKTAGRLKEAIIEFGEAHRLQPSEAGPLIEKARALFAADRGSEALVALHESLEKQPENPAVLATLMFYYIGVGDENRALQWWEHVRRQARMPPHIVTTLRQTFQQKFGHAPPSPQ